MLAIVTPVINTGSGTQGSIDELVDAFQPAILVPVAVALLGAAATLLDVRREPALAAETA